MEATTSRFFLKSDENVSTFSWKDAVWNMEERQWWSRTYEYAWVEQACRYFFGGDIKNKSAIDIATGILHPGIFVLKKAGFGAVTGTDLFDKEPHHYAQYIKNGINYIKEDILEPTIKDKFNCVSCVSFLEHLPPEYHKQSIINIINKCEDNGCIVLTFDMPGFEYKTDLELYKYIIYEHGFNCGCVETNEIDRLKSSECNANEECKKLNLYCYRLFAYR